MEEIKPLSVEEARQELEARMLAYRLEGGGALDAEPELLYHYSSLESACMILESAKIRASHIYFLNDASEVEYGADIVSECIDAFPGIPEDLRRLFRRATRGEKSEFIKNARIWPTHMFCLSKNPDSLSQWRAYGKSGGGIAIGFRKDRLHTISADGTPNPFFRIAYEKKDQVAATHELLAIVADIGERISPDGPGQDDFWKAVSVALAFINFRFKTPAFQEEGEWRLFLQNKTPNVRFRLAADGKVLIPYIEAEFSHDAVCKIVQGPLARPDVGESSLKEFLRAEGYEHVEVAASRIPLRAL
jgi:Protein of unknown function (DUF2971)